MCVLNDRLIRQWAEFGGLTPFDPACINPASVDLRWSGRLRCADVIGWGNVLDTESFTFPAAHQSLAYVDVTDDYGNKVGVEIANVPIPRGFFLLDTTEVVTLPNYLCGYLYLKSSIGRQGLEHLHAGFFDPGFSGTATLEIVNTAPWPVTIARGQRLVQLVLEQMAEAPMRSYGQTGRYNGQHGPQPAKDDKLSAALSAIRALRDEH